MGNLTNIALDYTAEGFGVLPLKDNKAPALPAGHNYLYEIMTDEDINRLFANAKKIGIACGDVSGGFECMDFDGHSGDNIEDIFNKFMGDKNVHDIVTSNRLPVVKTPSGGFHIYYKNPIKSSPGRALAKWENGEDVMIEIRGHGQYVATIPSDGYNQLAGCDIIKMPELSREEVEYLYYFAESLTLSRVVKKHDTTPGVWPDKFNDTVWGKYSEQDVGHMKELLVDAGWSLTYTRKTDGVEYWLRPGKDSRLNGSSATFGKFHNMFYCFSSAAYPFKERTAYTPFEVMMLLKFKGNKIAATEWLNKRYNIKPAPAVYEEIEPEVLNPEFPVDVFSPTIQEFINQLNGSLNYSKDYVSVAIMALFATLNGNKFKLRVKNGWDAPSIFWFAIVGEPGTMKTHPIKTIFKPLYKMDVASKSVFDAEVHNHNRLSEKEKVKTKRPQFKQIIVSDSTLEALHGIHGINKRGIMFYKDELIGFLNDMNRYRKGSDEQFWLESFNNSSYIVNRVTKDPMLIEDTNINIIGTIQPDILNGVISSHGSNGLTDRFLYTSNETNIYPISLNDIDGGWIRKWEEIAKDINDLCNYNRTEDTVFLRMEPGAMQVFVNMDLKFCEMQKSDNVTFQMKNYINKMKTYAPRFALLMNIFDMYSTGEMTNVTEAQMIRAAKIIEYFVQSAQFIFNNVEKDTEISEVSKRLEGKTKAEKIIELYNRGFKGIEIAKKLKTPNTYVSKIINQHK